MAPRVSWKQAISKNWISCGGYNAGIAAIAGGSGWTGAAIGEVAGGVVGNIKASKQQ